MGTPPLRYPEILRNKALLRVLLVGGWTNPFEKYARQIGSFPQVGMKIKNIWNHHLVDNCNPWFFS